jgi:metallo-beta-lactamase family protein
MMAKLTFLGGVGTVTGSKFLIDNGNFRILVDCGLFQGFKQLRLRNWAPLPVPPSSIDAVLLTHAHLDHSGYLPLLVKRGFKGPVYCTAATRDLCTILLPDSGFLQERDAEFANRNGFSKHSPALPLYTEREAEQALENLQSVNFDTTTQINRGVSAHFHRAGHILGAAIIELNFAGCRIVFSGDLGRPNSPTMPEPAKIEKADYLVVESTYGDRLHDKRDPEEALLEIALKTTSRGGSLLIPSFAVGRAQTLLFHLHRLRAAGQLKTIPIYLDSPMAIDASDLFAKHPMDHRLTAQEWSKVCAEAHYVRTAEESKVLDHDSLPKIIISASGMATGGRVLHHIKHMAFNHRNTILFTGFQAGGTRGASMIAGADSVKIHGQYIPIHAEIRNLEMLSAHADAGELLSWLGNFVIPPQQAFITHGEPAASDALRRSIAEKLGWECTVPAYRDQVDLNPGR